MHSLLNMWSLYIHTFSLTVENKQAVAGRDGRTVSRDQILRCERGQGNVPFPCSADDEQDWQPHPVDLYSAIIYIYIHASWKFPPNFSCHFNLFVFSDKNIYQVLYNDSKACSYTSALRSGLPVGASRTVLSLFEIILSCS